MISAIPDLFNIYLTILSMNYRSVLFPRPTAKVLTIFLSAKNCTKKLRYFFSPLYVAEFQELTNVNFFSNFGRKLLNRFK